MKKVYAEYFQKSKVFLYPLLEIKKGVRYVPIETYIAWEGVCELKDEKFIKLSQEIVAPIAAEVSMYKEHKRELDFQAEMILKFFIQNF